MPTRLAHASLVQPVVSAATGFPRLVSAGLAAYCGWSERHTRNLHASETRVGHECCAALYAGIPFYVSPFRWLASLIGFVSIVLIMMGSAKRLERTQGDRYGDLPEYHTYVDSVPVLFPFAPVYTLENIRVFLE